MDLTKGISIRIEGETTKNETLPVEVLIKLASKLQELIRELAITGLEDEPVMKIENFNIELSGFKGGSAVPEFIFTRQYQVALGVDISKQQKTVNDKLCKVLSISSKGDYTELNKEYPSQEKRNGIVKSLYEFINSVGDAPMSIVDTNLKPEYKLKQFPKKTFESLYKEIKIDKKEILKPTPIISLALIEDSGTVGPKKILKTYSNKVSATFEPEIINTKNKQYILKSPLRSKILEEEGKIIIENELLGIYAYGDDIDEAEEMFAEEFDYIYTRYNELKDEQLSTDVKFIKDYLNQIISQHE